MFLRTTRWPSQARTGGWAGMTSGVDENDFAPIWRNNLPVVKSDPITRVFVEEDLVFACTDSNVIYVLNRSDGVLKFINYVNGGGRPVLRPVLLTDRIIYPGQTNLEVYNRTTGDFLKTVNLGFTISGDVVTLDNDLYMGVDLSGGELVDVVLDRPYVPLRWQMMVFGVVDGAPAIHNGGIFVGSGDGGIRAVTPDREALWPLDRDAFFADGAIVGSVQADDDGVYAASASGQLVCLNPADGKIAPSIDQRTDRLNKGGWQYFAPHPLTTGPIVTSSMVYQPVPELGIVAIDKNKSISVDPDGRHKASQLIRTPRWSCPEAAQFVAENNQYSFFRSTDDQIIAVDKDSGHVVFRSGVKFSALSTNLQDNMIYAASPDGSLFALKPVLQPGSPGFLQ